ncbi:MAG: DUF3857 domain-containing protein [Parachlamydia sp.]|nr:DUF3857 domain-containing protein [Parachlamydia sp.]
MNFLRTVRQFNSLSAIQEGSIIEIEFNPESEALLIHTVLIHRNGETIDQAGCKTRIMQKEADSHKYIFTGSLTFTLFLEDIRVGDILEYAYSYHYKEPFIQNKFHFQTGEECEQLYYRLVAPSTIHLQYHGGFHAPAIRSLDEEDQEWIWEISPGAKGAFEWGQPSWLFPCDWLQISSFNHWDEVSKDAETQFPKEVILDAAIKAQVAKWKKEMPQESELILKLIRFVQNEVRYLSLDEGRLGPNCANDPNKTYFNRFGDCKDKTALLHYLLKEIGLESYPALVNTFLKEKTASLLPSLLFNHAILAIEKEGRLYWIDPTISHQGGTLENRTPLDYGYGLLIGKPGHSLTAIEKRGDASKLHTFVTFDLRKKNEQSRMSVETHFYGGEADKFRAQLDTESLNELSNQYISFYENHYPGIQVDKAIEFYELMDLNRIVLNESYLIPELGDRKVEKGKTVYYFKPFSLLAKLPSFESGRQTPLALEFPLEIREDIIVNSEKKIKFKEEITVFKNRCFEFTENWIRQNKHSMRAVYCLNTLKDHMVADESADVAAFNEQVGERCVYISFRHYSTWDKIVLVISFLIFIGQIIRMIT